MIDWEFATAAFLHAVGDRGWWAIARLKANLPELWRVQGKTPFFGSASGVNFPGGRV